MWRCHLRTQLSGIEIKALKVGRFVGLEIITLLNDFLRNTHGFQIVARDVVGCNQAHLSAHLCAHVGQRHALLHAKAANCFARKLNGLVVAAVHAKLANHVQHHVFGANAFLQCAMPLHSERLRHLHPNLAGGHHAQHFCGANAKHVGAKCTTSG